MRFTPHTGGHNLYRFMKNQWKVARKRPVRQSAGEEIMRDRNIEVVDANEFVLPPKTWFDLSSIVGLAPKETPKDENHPLYKENPCYMFLDKSVLLEGLLQALVLTNTIQLEHETLPAKLENMIDSVQLQRQDELVERCIKTSCLYDAEQKKLAIRKDPSRPAWRFPRDYGITESRKNRMLCNRLIHLCSLASPEVSARRAVLNHVPLSVPLTLDEDTIQFQLRTDMFISSDKPCAPFVSPAEVKELPLPELSISHPLISLHEEHFYELKDVFPLKEDTRFNQVHTIVVYYNDSEVKNIFETEVTVEQMTGRSLMKAFTAAVAQARYNYGPDVKDVPEPVVVQCVHTNGRSFHFSVLQLNTVDLSSNQHNVFWSLPPVRMYEECLYIEGVPVLEGYNPQVFKYLLAFYNNN